MSRRLVLGALLLVAAACGSGSSTPTAPTAGTTSSVGSLSVSGPTTAVAVGLPVQVVATFRLNGVTTDVTATTVWQSDTPAVARVSNTGVVTTIALGGATITAMYQSQVATTRVVVSIGSGLIAGCGQFSSPGSYTLANDLTTSTPAVLCVGFTQTSSVDLDCRRHDAISISIANAQNVNVHNCLMHANLPSANAARLGLNVMNVSALVVDASDVLGVVAVQGCVGCTFSNNTFVAPAVGSSVASEFQIFLGANNRIVNNVVDGAWLGDLATWGKQGCDDGVLVENDANILIEGNTIRHVFDAGIEAAAYTQTSPGPVTAIIRDNRIEYAGFTGIGAYYVTGWQNSVFSGNIVSASPNLLTLIMNTGAAPAHGVTLGSMTLVNNQFLNNTLLNAVDLPPNYGGGQQASAYINYAVPLPGAVTGNVFQGNNLGTTTAAPLLLPASGFADGGGNICQAGGGLTCAGVVR
jgi:hypothetical protein